MKLVSDVDNVLLDFSLAFRRWTKRVHNIEIPFKHQYDFGLEPDLAYKLIGEFWDSDEIEKLPAYAGAKAGLNYFGQTFEVHIATALPEKYRTQRVKNLEGFNYESMYMGSNKTDHIINNIKPIIAIEDKPKNIQILSEAGIRVFYPILEYTKGMEQFGTPYENWYYLMDLIKYENWTPH